MHDSYLKSKSFLVPTALWILFLCVVLVLLGSGDTRHDYLWRTLIQWDGQHYLSIARDGYIMHPCPEEPSLICGNVGWFPLFPLVARGVGQLTRLVGMDMRWTILLTGFLCFWLALLVLYRLVEKRFGGRAATISIIALMLFPASFYYATAFPYALYLLLAVLTFRFLDTKEYLAAAVPAGLLAVTYPSGIVIGLPILWALVSDWSHRSTRERISLAAAGAAIGIALLAYGLYYWIQFDNFMLYVQFQSKPYYAHEPAFPLVPVAKSLLNLPAAHPVFIMLVFAIATTALFYTRKVPVGWQLYLFGVLLFTPTFGTTTCYYRHIVVAFPLFVMIGLAADSPRRKWLLPVYAAAGLILMWTVYLKYYKLGMLM